MEPIRILLVDMPRMARELIDGAVATQRDMRVVGVVLDTRHVLEAARETNPTFVIVGVDGERFPDECVRVLDEQPKVKLLGIEADAGTAILYELRPEKHALGAVSPADVVDAIRGAAARDREA